MDQFTFSDYRSRGPSYSFHPVSQGTITDVALQTKVWEYAIRYELNVEDASEAMAILVDSYHNTQATREQMVEAALRKLGFGSVMVIPQELLIAYSLCVPTNIKTVTNKPTSTPISHPKLCSEVTALVVDIGFQQIRIVPVIQGAVHSYAARVLDAGVQNILAALAQSTDITSHFLLPYKNSFASHAEIIMRNYCYALLDGQQQEPEVIYDPEGYTFEGTLTLTSELHECVEILFCPHEWTSSDIAFTEHTYQTDRGNCIVHSRNPEHYFGAPNPNKTQESIQEKGATTLQAAILSVLQKSPLQFRAKLATNIILAGGFAQVRNLPERLAFELEKLKPMCNFAVKMLPAPSVLQVNGYECFKRLQGNSNVITKQQFEAKGVSADLWERLYVRRQHPFSKTPSANCDCVIVLQ